MNIFQKRIIIQLLLIVTVFYVVPCNAKPLENWPVVPLPTGIALWFGEPLDKSLEIDFVLFFKNYRDNSSNYFTGPAIKIELGEDGSVSGLGYRYQIDEQYGGTLSVFASYLSPWSSQPKYIEGDTSYYGVEFEIAAWWGLKLSYFKEKSGNDEIHSTAWGVAF